MTHIGTNVRFTSTDGGIFEGTLSGNTMTYTGGIVGQAGYTESGVWTMQGADNFTKISNYSLNNRSGGGSCTGTGVRQ